MDRDEKIEQLLTAIRDNQQRQIELSQEAIDSHKRAQGRVIKLLIPLFILLVLTSLWSFLIPFLSTATP